MKPNTRQLTVHVRRLASDGDLLYIRIDRNAISELQLRHGDHVELRLDPATCLRGIVKTSGASPWLAPDEDGSNVSLTKSIRDGGYEHGDNVAAEIEIKD